jgi:uncharacterized membrane protein YbhN (UPF0104 family)
MKTFNTDRKTTTFWSIAKFLLAFILVGFVLSKTDVRDILDRLKNVSVSWLVLSTFLFLLVTLLKAGQYYILMWEQVTYLQILNAVILQNVVSNFLATGAGIASLVGSLRVEHGVKVGRSMTMFLLTKAGDLTAIWLALMVSSFILWQNIAILHIPVIVLSLSIGMILIVFAITVSYRQRAVGIICSVLDRLKLSSFGIIVKALDMLRSLAEIDSQRIMRTLFLTVGMSAIYLIGSIVLVYANLMVFGVHISMEGVAFTTVLLQLISYFPIQVFGGLGVSETSSMYFLGFFNVSLEILAPVLVGVRILSYLFNLIPLIYLSIYTTFMAKKDNG